MRPERWQQVEAVYRAALDRPANERDAFLEATCAGDTTLHRDVESLLGYAAAADAFFATPA
jgi:eukaryotic-like serine/threonine-protein kinase